MKTYILIMLMAAIAAMPHLNFGSIPRGKSLTSLLGDIASRFFRSLELIK